MNQKYLLLPSSHKVHTWGTRALKAAAAVHHWLVLGSQQTREAAQAEGGVFSDFIEISGTEMSLPEFESIS